MLKATFIKWVQIMAAMLGIGFEMYSHVAR